MPTDSTLPEKSARRSDVRRVIPVWSAGVPVAAWLLFAFVAPASFGGAGILLLGVALFATVFAAVHHAEVIAHRIGEPFGTLVLALAVTVIEVALIVSIMLSSKGEASLARDTVFAAVILACNGVLGICLLVAGIRFGEPLFRARAASSYLAVLAVLATAALVLPEFTHSSAGSTYTDAQLIFVAVVAVVLYGVFLFVQTVRHRDYFLPVGTGSVSADAHAEPPSTVATGIAAVLLLVALGIVVLLAKTLSPGLEAAMRAAGFAQPAAAVGVVVAALVLLPEAVSAIRAARLNRLQTSVNLALGSALASIALTIPAVAAVALWTGQPLELGLGDTGLVFLALTVVVTTLTLSSGRATLLQGAVHLAILALFLFLVIVP